MVLILHPLRAFDGDCYLIEYGEPENTRKILIDGGPRNSFHLSLQPLLPERSSLELIIATHGSDSHLGGLIELAKVLMESYGPPPCSVWELWHNSVDNLLGASYEKIIELINKEAGQHYLPPTITDLVQSIEVSRRLLHNFHGLKARENAPWSGRLITSGQGRDVVGLKGGLKIRILGPYQGYVDDLRRDWHSQIIGLTRASVPRYLDATHCLTSIYFLVEYKNKTLLFASNARGEHVVGSLRAQGLLSKGKLHVDVLTVPNHGASRSADASFYRAITADHYVISANGKHGNPEIAILQMISDARRNKPFHIHLTHPPEEYVSSYPVDELKKLFLSWRKERKEITVHSPRPRGPSPIISLLESPTTSRYVDHRSPDSLWAPEAGSRIFLSYNQSDAEFMSNLTRDLDSAGFDVWAAGADLEPGTPDWTSAVEEALDGAECMVVILSPNAKKSRWVKRELYYAEARGIQVIPVLAKGNGKNAVPLEVAHVQHIDATDEGRYSEAVDLTITAIVKILRTKNNRQKSVKQRRSKLSEPDKSQKKRK